MTEAPEPKPKTEQLLLTEGAAPAVPERDPDVLAEQKKNKIWHLRLERYREGVVTFGFFLQTFRSESVSLVSGLGTLVAGWFQIRKWVAQGRAESRSAGQHDQLEYQVSGKGVLEIKSTKAHPAVKALAVKPSAHPKIDALQLDLQTTTLAPSEIPPQVRTEDPMNYALAGLTAVFVLSSIAAWVKRKRKQIENTGGPNGSI